MKNKVIIFIVCFVCLLTNRTFSQNKNGITGNLISNNSTIAYASILLYSEKDSIKPISTAITDSLGKFFIIPLLHGNYQLWIRAIGFQTKKIPFVINANNSNLLLKDIQLLPDNSSLESVTVTAQKKLIQRTSQGFIVNASASITQLGGTATDLLRSTPTVVVDAEGVITMRGKTPLILINGRNSSITNVDQIAASSIETIEIISSPTAQYDADAEGGIINITLKKGKLAGTNGAVAIGAGFGAKGRINSSFLLNHKTDKWNLGVAYDNRFAGRERYIDAVRINYDSPNQYQINQDRYDSRVESLQNLRLTTDYSPNKSTTLGLELILSGEGQDNNETLNSKITSKSNIIQSNTQRVSIEIANAFVTEFAFNYSHKFNSNGSLLTANISSSFDKDQENTDISSQPLDGNNKPVGTPYLQKTHNYEDVIVSNIKTDFLYPISEKSKIETGYKAIIRKLDADYQQYDQTNGVMIPNAKASNVFAFDEQIHALYAQFSSVVGAKNSPIWKYDIGLRAEKVLNSGVTVSQAVSFNNNYFNVFPTANLVYYQAPEQFWKISYGRRINRPGLGQLNPFVDITDSLNQHSGNPYLKPELVNAFELGFNKDWTNYSLYSAIFYRHATNAIRDLIEVLPNGVAIRKPVNYGIGNTYGLENVFTAKPLKEYDFSLSATLFRQTYSGENVAQDFVSELFSWNTKLINNVQLSKNGKMQITGIYNSPIATPQGERIANYNVDLGFQQKLGKGNSRIGLVITDIFNSLQSGTYTQGSDFNAYRISKSDTRAFIITFAHTFGTKFKEKLMDNQFSIE